MYYGFITVLLGLTFFFNSYAITANFVDDNSEYSSATDFLSVAPNINNPQEYSPIPGSTPGTLKQLNSKLYQFRKNLIVGANLGFNWAVPHNTTDSNGSIYQQDDTNFGYNLGINLEKAYKPYFRAIKRMTHGVNIQYKHLPVSGDMLLFGENILGCNAPYKMDIDALALALESNLYFKKFIARDSHPWLGLNLGVGLNLYSMQLAGSNPSTANNDSADLGIYNDFKRNRDVGFLVNAGPFISFPNGEKELRMGLIYSYLHKLNSGTREVSGDVGTAVKYSAHTLGLNMTYLSGVHAAKAPFRERPYIDPIGRLLRKFSNTMHKMKDNMQDFTAEDFSTDVGMGIPITLPQEISSNDSIFKLDNDNVGVMAQVGVHKSLKFEEGPFKKLTIGPVFKYFMNRPHGDLWLYGINDPNCNTPFKFIIDSYVFLGELNLSLQDFDLGQSKYSVGLKAGAGANLYSFGAEATNYAQILNNTRDLDVLIDLKKRIGVAPAFEVGGFLAIPDGKNDFKIGLSYVYLGRLKSSTRSNLGPEFDLREPIRFTKQEIVLEFVGSFPQGMGGKNPVEDLG